LLSNTKKYSTVLLLLPNTAAQQYTYREPAITVVKDNLHIARDGCMPSTLLQVIRFKAEAAEQSAWFN
jgi:hypothetical protein